MRSSPARPRRSGCQALARSRYAAASSSSEAAGVTPSTENGSTWNIVAQADYSRRVEVTREDQAFAASALVQGLSTDAPIGFAVHDEQLRFEVVSNSMAAINGRRAADHLGRSVAEIL